MIDFECPQCGGPMSVPGCLGGKNDVCPRCRQTVPVPEAQADLIPPPIPLIASTHSSPPVAQRASAHAPETGQAVGVARERPNAESRRTGFWGQQTRTVRIAVIVGIVLLCLVSLVWISVAFSSTVPHDELGDHILDVLASSSAVSSRLGEPLSYTDRGSARGDTYLQIATGLIGKRDETEVTLEFAVFVSGPEGTAVAGVTVEGNSREGSITSLAVAFRDGHVETIIGDRVSAVSIGCEVTFSGGGEDGDD